MFTKAVLGLLLVLALDDTLSVHAEPSWTSLRVTWSLNLLSSRAFARLPRRESSARSEHWTKVPGTCAGGKFLGNRYIKGSDPAVVLLYDVNGYIAGIQSGIPKKDVGNLTSHHFANSNAYQLDTVAGEETYFITAYFVDPSIICQNGRTENDYDDQGTGTGLYFQNGTDPVRDAVHVPLYQEGLNVTHWVRGQCFPSMGVHYWYEMTSSFDCTNFFPATIIYNRGKLTSFAFASFGYYEFSSRFEHPPESALNAFLPTPVPQCIKDEYASSGGFTTLHVFFSVRPWNILC